MTWSRYTDQWLSQNAQLIKLASDQNQAVLPRCNGLGIIHIVLIVLAFYLAGAATRSLRPLQRIMAHIQTIADGNLTMR